MRLKKRYRQVVSYALVAAMTVPTTLAPMTTYGAERNFAGVQRMEESEIPDQVKVASPGNASKNPATASNAVKTDVDPHIAKNMKEKPFARRAVCPSLTAVVPQLRRTILNFSMDDRAFCFYILGVLHKICYLYSKPGNVSGRRRETGRQRGWGRGWRDGSAQNQMVTVFTVRGDLGKTVMERRGGSRPPSRYPSVCGGEKLSVFHRSSRGTRLSMAVLP